MRINLQDDYPHSTFPAEFLNPEFVITLNEIRSIVCKCDDTNLNLDSRQLYNVLLSVTEDDEFKTYCISLKFDFGNRDNRHPEYIHGWIEQKFYSFEGVVNILKSISANMRAIEAADENNTLSSRDRAAMILHNFSHYLEAVIVLQDGNNWTDIGVLNIKGNNEDAEMYKPLIPEWVTTRFNVSYTGFGYGYEEEDLKDLAIKERFFKFILKE